MKRKHYIFMLLSLMLLLPETGNAQYKWGGHDLWNNLKIQFARTNNRYNGQGTLNDKTVYFQNVGAQDERRELNCYLNSSFGHWGIEASLYQRATPFYLNWLGNKNAGERSMIFNVLSSPDPATAADNRMIYIGYKSSDDNGIFFDHRDEATYKAKDPQFPHVKSDKLKTRWIFKPVPGHFQEGDYRYFIYYEDAAKSTFYLCRKPRTAGLRKHAVSVYYMDAEEAKENADAQWRIFTRADMIGRYTTESTEHISEYADPIDATFHIGNQNFSRRNRETPEWILEPGENGAVYIGNDARVPQNGDDSEEERAQPYTVDRNEYNGVVGQVTNRNNGESVIYNSVFGMFYNAEIQNAGTIRQETAPVSVGGYYMVTVQGFYQPAMTHANRRNAVLFARTVNPDNTNQIQEIENPLPLCNSLANPPKTHTEAGIRFYENYENYSCKVIIKVKAGEKIELGVRLEGGATGDWVCLDNMQLKYLGTEYLISQYFANDRQYPLHDQHFQTLILERDFKAGKWNSFCLPTNLNKDQVATAFGTDVEVAAPKGISDDGMTILFEKVDLDKLAWEDVAIHKNRPYLVKPVKRGREYEIVWPNYLDQNNQPIHTYGPNYIIHLTQFKPAESAEEPLEFTNARGQKVIFRNLHYMRVPENQDYQRIEVSPEHPYIYAMDEGRLRRMTKSFGINGLTFYIEFGEKPAAGAKLRVIGDDDDAGTTGIMAVEDSEDGRRTRQGVYNLCGQKVAGGSDLSGLPAGIYIVNGRKVTVNQR